ncbi:MAG: dTDP-4-amino-4,6-dideoxygalactose transaminase [Bacteroidetes bacterium]|nr:dTDP-4-amino-4,6-dideoxygalactose transaminase [Bacteroidota bacterium]
MNYRIPFNKPHFTSREAYHVSAAISLGKISGNGVMTQKCHSFFEKKYHFRKALLTSSCTDALEMAAILCDIQPGDEVIIPSFTFVSTANAFVLRGAKIVFADSMGDHPNIDASLLESLITPRTKAIIPVHYAGIACDMDVIMQIGEKHGILVIEDAAHAIDSYYRKKALGSIGQMATFSFHETKNITSGEGGLFVVNDSRFIGRSEIIWEKGTNRAAFYRGEVDKYGWVDIGSSFLPSDLTAAFLYGQIEMLGEIQRKRKEIHSRYLSRLSGLEQQAKLSLPTCPDYATQNGHLFYILTSGLDERDQLIRYLGKNGIQAVFHYLPLHSSSFYSNRHDGRELSNADRYARTLIRLPFFYDLTENEIDEVSDLIHQFYKS